MGKFNWDMVCQEAEKLGCGPLSLGFYEFFGKIPTQEELRRFIDLIINPTERTPYASNLKNEQFLRFVRYGNHD